MIFEFRKNALEVVRFEVTEFNGSQYLNVRVFYDAGQGVEPEYKPSRKGITIAAEQVPDLKHGIDLAVEYLEKEKSNEQIEEQECL